MLSAFSNVFKIPELRQRILFTLAMIIIVRIGAAITLPGVDATVIQEWIKAKADGDGAGQQLGALFNIFSGGGLTNCAIFSLGIMPYISASIMMQLMTAIVPKLSKLAREDGGRQKITMYTRYITILLCLVQGYFVAKSLVNPANNIFLPGIAELSEQIDKPLVPNGGWGFIALTILTITAGTMVLMWLGEQITERGIGNGISIIICVNIISSLPGTLVMVWKTYVGGEDATPIDSMKLVMLVVVLLLVTAGVIALTQAMRRIPIRHAKRVVGRQMMGSQQTYLPLKVNYAGVMPIIFASTILLFPATILAQLFPNSDFARSIGDSLNNGGWPYYVVSALLIFFFSYFWVATMFKPAEIADDLKRRNGYVPGVRPGKPTADFLDFTMSRLTFAGALFLTMLYLMPYVLGAAFKIPSQTLQIFGGTSLLIMVGVLLDSMRQVETHLLQRHYDGFLKKGRIRGRNDRTRPSGGGSVASGATVIWLWVAIAIIVLLACCYIIYRNMA